MSANELPFLTLQFEQDMEAWAVQLGELGIGTFGNVIVIRKEEPIARAVALFCEHRISSIPVVSADGSPSVWPLTRQGLYTM